MSVGDGPAGHRHFILSREQFEQARILMPLGWAGRQPLAVVWGGSIVCFCGVRTLSLPALRYSALWARQTVKECLWILVRKRKLFLFWFGGRNGQ